MTETEKHRSKEATLIIKDWLSLYPQEWDTAQRRAVHKLVAHALKKRDLRWENILKSQGFDVTIKY